MVQLDGWATALAEQLINCIKDIVIGNDMIKRLNIYVYGYKKGSQSNIDGCFSRLRISHGITGKLKHCTSTFKFASWYQTRYSHWRYVND